MLKSFDLKPILHNAIHAVLLWLDLLQHFLQDLSWSYQPSPLEALSHRLSAQSLLMKGKMLYTRYCKHDAIILNVTQLLQCMLSFYVHVLMTERTIMCSKA